MPQRFETAPTRMQSALATLIVSAMMTLVVSGISSLRAQGLGEWDAALWLSSWLASWGVAFPLLLVLQPAVRRFVSQFPL